MASSALSLTGASPSSKLFSLSSLGGMTFSITTNGGWYDVISFLTPGTISTPLDISGIDFHAELRRTVGDANNILDMSTTNTPPQFISGGTSGNLFFSVDVSLLIKLTAGIYVMDMLAKDTVTGMVRNLCEQAPIVVTVNQGITR